MNSRVVGIIKLETPPMDGQGRDRGLRFSDGEEGLTLDCWLSALVGGSAQGSDSLPRWESRFSLVPSPRRVRANLQQLAEELNHEYLELAAM